MSSRADILASIRANLPRLDRPLPEEPLFDADPPPSLVPAFKESLESFEYGLIAALIAVAAVIVMSMVGTHLSITFNPVQGDL